MHKLLDNFVFFLLRLDIIMKQLVDGEDLILKGTGMILSPIFMLEVVDAQDLFLVLLVERNYELIALLYRASGPDIQERAERQIKIFSAPD